MRPIKCVLVGDGAVGKTSLLISYTTNSFPQDYIPTVFDNYSTTLVLPEGATGPDQESQIFKLNLWDTAGQEEYDRLRPLSYPQTDIFLVCFSVVERSSLRNVTDKWYPEIRENCNSGNPELLRRLGKRPILLVGTKTDLRDQEEEEIAGVRSPSADYISPEEAQQVAEHCGFMGYVECSAATQVGVREVFEAAVRSCVYEPQRLLDEQNNNDQRHRQLLAAREEEQQRQLMEQQQKQQKQSKLPRKKVNNSNNRSPSKNNIGLVPKNNSPTLSQQPQQVPPTGTAASNSPSQQRQASSKVRKSKKSPNCVIL
ncbi:hypothetical protein ZYGR_0I04040 [Zygosaccharomyces rouxii]|uniref:ZYRO0C09680p n=2 Tax=Zygosaccharomyces rouxii TaxID=4956 RepID=C5DTM1_ZYGRC|nr:uncharacterized protein ZYRO0C09680g [Zygosaccharomyces rouxii]KAH9201689.1 ras family-domain-containing protein [Zygosaccharomyces rouxii]GAV48107.1 hypothetical protein ZYGR_0I04040 [Zygosaccharomyces rouxii]CAR27132.1 ZYRO0C09680p [Zygosaccharomyces rouxii]